MFQNSILKVPWLGGTVWTCTGTAARQLRKRWKHQGVISDEWDFAPGCQSTYHAVEITYKYKSIHDQSTSNTYTHPLKQTTKKTMSNEHNQIPGLHVMDMMAKETLSHHGKVQKQGSSMHFLRTSQDASSRAYRGMATSASHMPTYLCRALAMTDLPVPRPPAITTPPILGLTAATAVYVSQYASVWRSHFARIYPGMVLWSSCHTHWALDCGHDIHGEHSYDHIFGNVTIQRLRVCIRAAPFNVHTAPCSVGMLFVFRYVKSILASMLRIL